ncbi:MAG: Hsp20 family protein [Anaerolineae bacterium]|nr:Hsp20 family protein [Anaerolineae bacterium]
MIRRRWDPVTGLVTMQQAMDRFFDEPWAPRRAGWREDSPMAVLPLDVYSTDHELVIKASVSGLEPEDVEITIEGDRLTIRGEICAPLENVEYHIQERRYGPFGRTLTLNIPVETENAEATFQNGELTLIIPKAEEVRPKVIKVKAS